MKYFIIAGERSGDQHAARLAAQIFQQDHAAEISGWGGILMKQAGVSILRNYSTYSVMGFWEVLINIRHLSRELKRCKADILAFKPDVVILVDFPGFNLRMARFAKTRGFKTCYYISPKIWAWKKGRIRTIRKYIDKMLVILPFEKDFYQNLGYQAQYVGNPSVEMLGSHDWDKEFESRFSEKAVIAFLPGSRPQEVRVAVAEIAQLAVIFDEYTLLVSAVDNVDQDLYAPLYDIQNVEVIFGRSFELMKMAKVAIVTSGTATLEAALIDVPQIVVYKTSWLTYWVARWLIKVRFISLVNIIAGRGVVRELIQDEYNAMDITHHLELLLQDEGAQKKISEGYSEIRKLLGNEHASVNAARAVITLGSS